MGGKEQRPIHPLPALALCRNDVQMLEQRGFLRTNTNYRYQDDHEWVHKLFFGDISTEPKRRKKGFEEYFTDALTNFLNKQR